MSVEIKNLVINVHVSGAAAEKEQERLNALRSDILDACKEYIDESVERVKER